MASGKVTRRTVDALAAAIRLEATEAVLNHLGASRAAVAGVHRRRDWNEDKRAGPDKSTAPLAPLLLGEVPSPWPDLSRSGQRWMPSQALHIGGWTSRRRLLFRRQRPSAKPVRPSAACWPARAHFADPTAQNGLRRPLPSRPLCHRVIFMPRIPGFAGPTEPRRARRREGAGAALYPHHDFGRAPIEWETWAQRRQARRLVNNAITSFRKDTSTSSKTEA